MDLWSTVLLVGAVGFGIYFARAAAAGAMHRRHCRLLARQRGSGSFSAFRSRLKTDTLTEPQLAEIYAFLRAHGAPGFDILPTDSLEQEFGVRRRYGVPIAEFLDDLRVLLGLPRVERVNPGELQTIGDLLEELDRESSDSNAKRLK
jgi:hypothetical protein